MLGELLEQPGVTGYVVINFDGIPVKSHPETIPAVHARLAPSRAQCLKACPTSLATASRIRR